ncbi:hypothetical protein VQ044_15145 [Aurantimonas sp. C2-5-R2]|uniref:hypothetical protein n=1 Tax=Aurantimonas sp. C2-5-R2 TaxID=3113713 RepID=UPI002F923AC1
MIEINGRNFVNSEIHRNRVWQRPPYLPQAAPAPSPVAANNNRKAASGKAAHQWPAMARATAGTLLDDPRANRVAAAVLAGFAALYADVSIDPSAIPSPAGRIAELSLADVREGDDGEGDFPDGYGAERLMSNEATAETLIALHKAGELRIVPGEIEPYLVLKNGQWRTLRMDTFRQPRGPVAKSSKPLTVGSSGTAAVSRPPSTPQLDRLIAMESIESIRGRMDNDSWAGLVDLAVHKMTARQLGERHGLTFKRAEALGGELMRKYITAAIAAFELPDAANDNNSPERLAA